MTPQLPRWETKKVGSRLFAVRNAELAMTQSSNINRYNLKPALFTLKTIKLSWSREFEDLVRLVRIYFGRKVNIRRNRNA